MEITKLSTKGQVVIPDEIRRGMGAGTAFAVVKKDDLIVLKKLDGFSEKEIGEIQELQQIWKEIDEGKGKTYGKKGFLKELEKW